MAVVATFNVNEDEKCPQCGRGGAVNHGVCLECITKNLKRSAGMEFKGVNVSASKVDLVNGKGTIGFTINMEDLLDQRDRLREWADAEVPLVITIEPMQRPLEGFETIGTRHVPDGKAKKAA